MTNSTNQSLERQRIAAEYLTRAADDFRRATRTRIYYAQLGRQYGLAVGDIATFLDVSEHDARQLVERHQEAA
jgi:hypothetical protein